MTTVPPILIVIIVRGLCFVILNSAALGLSVHVRELLESYVENWKMALAVLLINFILLPALALGFVKLAAGSMPGQLQIGFCMVGLAAGAPFAPKLTGLARGNVTMSASLMIPLMVLTVILLPLELPPVVSAIDSSVKLSAWDVAWPLLVFFLLPLVIGTLVRLRWQDAALEGAHVLGVMSLAFLVVHVTLYLYAFWSDVTGSWGTGEIVAAIAFPLIGVACGYLLVSILRVEDVGSRHACEITTGQRNVTACILTAIFPLGKYVVTGVSVLIVSIIAIVVLAVFAMEWGRAATHERAATETVAPPQHAAG